MDIRIIVIALVLIILVSIQYTLNQILDELRTLRKQKERADDPKETRWHD